MPGRRTRIMRHPRCWLQIGCVAASLLVLAIAVHTTASAEGVPAVFLASGAGQRTLDEGDGGGNPFASALIDLLGRPEIRLRDLPGRLTDLTIARSAGAQRPDVPVIAVEPDWPLAAPPPGETRIALVLVVSDYTGAHGAPPLAGARRDAHRIAAALTRAGFHTEVALDADLAGMRQALAAFALRSRGADAALIYTTGHGVEVFGSVYLLPSAYPIPEGRIALERAALPLREIRNSLRARRVNMLFYGGCRDDPF